MKKIGLLVLALLLTSLVQVQAQSQPWLKNFSNGPIKLQDVINEWQQTHAITGNEEDEEKGEEDDNYQFDRWVNYWKAHLDENGYIAPVATIREWLKYQQRTGLRNARTTGTPAWTFVGPKVTNRNDSNGNGIGRIITAAYHPTDTNTFWVGTAGGGAWKTTDGGNTWTCMTDNTYPVRGVSEIVINPLNPNTIYLCTGDRDAKDCYSFGVLKSYNGGITWDTTGLVWTESTGVLTNAMVINKLDTNTLVLATNIGLYRSLDGGASFNRVQTGYFNQVFYNTADTNILYAAANTNIFRSANGGATWTAVTSFTAPIRIAIAVCPQNPGIVKAITANSAYGLEGIYSSSDTGKTFSRIYNADTSCILNILSFDPKLRSSSCGGQGWYDLCIVINPLDSNSVYIGGVNVWHSVNGGASWKISNQWTKSLKLEVVHADKHYLGYNPINPHYIFEGNDGGFYRSSYRSIPDTVGALWTDLSTGLGISQFYRIGLSDMADYVLGGAQDNGTKQVFADSTHQAGGADGMTCVIDYTNPDIFYFSSQYGSFRKTTDGGKSSIPIKFATTAPTGAWTTPFIIDPRDNNVLYAGFSNLYYSIDQGVNWTTFPTYPVGGIIDRIVVHPQNNTYIFVLVNNIIRYTKDAGNTWKLISGIPGTATEITVDPNDTSKIWVSIGGYTVNKVAYYDLPTSSWHLQNGTLPKIPVHCITIDNENSNIYIGTDVGVYYRDKFMSDWALYNNGLPVVQVNDLEINYATGELWAGTYGRGMWKTAKSGPAANISVIPYADNVITTSPNPNKGHFNVSTANTALINKAVSTKLMNGLGQVVWQGTGSFDASGKLQVHADGLARGPYIFEVATNSMIARTRVVILQ